MSKNFSSANNEAAEVIKETVAVPTQGATAIPKIVVVEDDVTGEADEPQVSTVREAVLHAIKKNRRVVAGVAGIFLSAVTVKLFLGLQSSNTASTSDETEDETPAV